MRAAGAHPVPPGHRPSRAQRDHEGAIAGRDVPPAEIVELAKKYRCASISYTYTEPTIYFELAYDTARLARAVLLRDEVRDCKLGTLARHFRTSVEPVHRAYADAAATAEGQRPRTGELAGLAAGHAPGLEASSRFLVDKLHAVVAVLGHDQPPRPTTRRTRPATASLSARQTSWALLSQNRAPRRNRVP